MSFWNNHDYDQLKALLLLVILGGGGYFAFQFAGNPASSQSGSILEATRDTSVQGSGVTTQTVTELNKEVERLNKVRTSDAWYVFEGRKKRAEKSLVETLEVRTETISSLATEGKTVDSSEIALSEDIVVLLPEVAQIEIETPVTITGELYTEHVDDLQTPENTFFRSYIITDEGKEYSLLPSQDLVTEKGRVVIGGYVQGETIIGNPMPLFDNAVNKIGSANVKRHDHGEIVFDPSVKPRKLLVLLVRYTDSKPEVPFTPEDAHNLIFNGSFNDFYFEQSYGKEKYEGDVFGWLTIPRASSPCDVDVRGGEINEYLEEMSIDLMDYDDFTIYTDCNGDHGAAGFASILPNEYILGSGNTRYSQMMFTEESYSWQAYTHLDLSPYVWTYLDRMLAHEIGHTLLGDNDDMLGHSNGLDCYPLSYRAQGYECQSVEYGNYFDQMGIPFNSMHFNGYYKYIVGWIPDEGDIVRITETGTYTINALEIDSDRKYAEIRSPNPLKNEIIYNLEYRRGIGFDATLDRADLLQNQNGLLISKIHNDIFGFKNQLISMNPNSEWLESTKHAVLFGKAKVFQDPDNGIIIGPIIDRTDDSITFKVSIENNLCERRAPELALKKKHKYIYSGIDLHAPIPIITINKDSAFCADMPFFEYSFDVGALEPYTDYVGQGYVHADSFEETVIAPSPNYGDSDINMVPPGTYPIIVTATNPLSGLSSDPLTVMFTIKDSDYTPPFINIDHL